mmetsp:Transcript_4011/g.9660  ORF Transcript_4011/g.9660 Transcript_4011/m.9660 type:complete len:276 (-) Transcript_4011:1100-1927(-)
MHTRRLLPEGGERRQGRRRRQPVRQKTGGRLGLLLREVYQHRRRGVRRPQDHGDCILVVPLLQFHPQLSDTDAHTPQLSGHPGLLRCQGDRRNVHRGSPRACCPQHLEGGVVLYSAPSCRRLDALLGGVCENRDPRTGGDGGGDRGVHGRCYSCQAGGELFGEGAQAVWWARLICPQANRRGDLGSVQRCASLQACDQEIQIVSRRGVRQINNLRMHFLENTDSNTEQGGQPALTVGYCQNRPLQVHQELPRLQPKFFDRCRIEPDPTIAWVVGC